MRNITIKLKEVNNVDIFCPVTLGRLERRANNANVVASTPTTPGKVQIDHRRWCNVKKVEYTSGGRFERFLLLVFASLVDVEGMFFLLFFFFFIKNVL